MKNKHCVYGYIQFILGFLTLIWFLWVFLFGQAILEPLLIMGLCLVIWGFLNIVAYNPADESDPKP